MSLIETPPGSRLSLVDLRATLLHFFNTGMFDAADAAIDAGRQRRRHPRHLPPDAGPHGQRLRLPRRSRRRRRRAAPARRRSLRRPAGRRPRRRRRRGADGAARGPRLPAGARHHRSRARRARPDHAALRRRRWTPGPRRQGIESTATACRRGCAAISTWQPGRSTTGPRSSSQLDEVRTRLRRDGHYEASAVMRRDAGGDVAGRRSAGRPRHHDRPGAARHAALRGRSGARGAPRRVGAGRPRSVGRRGPARGFAERRILQLPASCRATGRRRSAIAAMPPPAASP